MAIQMRRGAIANLDTSKLVAGEWVMGTDNGQDNVGIAKSASDVIWMATRTEVQAKQDKMTWDGNYLVI